MTAEQLRQTIRERIALFEEARELGDLIHARREAGKASPRTIIRCRQHKGGKAPKLAEVCDLAAHDLGEGFLFVSQPAWVPRDQLEMPPFMVEHLLGRGAAAIVDMEGGGDDDALLRYAHQLSTPQHATGERWLVKQDPHLVLTVVKPGEEPVLGAWVRCREHLADQHAYSYEELARLT